MEEELTVTSEVHHFSKEEKLDGRLGAVLSRFDFVYPPHMTHGARQVTPPTTDEDGDLQVTRREDLTKREGVVLIEHQSATTLDLVGEQVWRGALFLADFVLHRPEVFRGVAVLEVAAGVGLTSVVASMLARKVLVTDIDRGDILSLIERNMERNAELCVASRKVLELDFFDHNTIADAEVDLDDVTIIIAADTIYHNQLTDAFFRTIYRLMSRPPNKTMYIALEKRFVFTLEDMDTVAPCYEYFLDRLEWLRKEGGGKVDWTLEQMDINFPQYFTYERTRHLVLWKIQAELK